MISFSRRKVSQRNCTSLSARRLAFLLAVLTTSLENGVFDSKSAFRGLRQFELENFFGGSLLSMGIINNNPDMVQQGLLNGEDPNKRYSYEKDTNSITTPNPVRIITPIVQAAVIESLPITKLLVQHGANVNLCQRNGESALANAANRGNAELTSFLLEHGADPNLTKSFGTPLAMANGVTVMKMLLDHGADPNIPDSDGDLPIIGCIDMQNLQEIELLINYGTDMNHTNRLGETPIDRARKRGIYDAVLSLLQNAKPVIQTTGPIKSTKASNYVPKVSVACMKDDFAVVATLLKSGADPNELSSAGRAPLFYCKDIAPICLLEHYGADVNVTDESGNTPLATFLESNMEESSLQRAVTFLIDAGTDVDMKNVEGRSARDIVDSLASDAIKSAFAQGLDNVKRRKCTYEDKLSEQKANLNEWYLDSDPLKPGGSWEAEIVICSNACTLSDLNLLKAKEEFVRDNLTVTTGREGTNSRNMLMRACADASTDVVKYLLSLGADPNQTDSAGQNSLRYAAISWRDAAEKIDLLVSAGADVNHRSNDGSAALSDAAYEQNVPAAKALIANGADVNNRDNQGYTALSWTCGKGAPQAEIVELLLREGADIYDLYNMNCVLQYLDYKNGFANGIPREVFLRPRELKEKYLYEYALIPGIVSSNFKQQLASQGFDF